MPSAQKRANQERLNTPEPHQLPTPQATPATRRALPIGEAVPTEPLRDKLQREIATWTDRHHEVFHTEEFWQSCARMEDTVQYKTFQVLNEAMDAYRKEALKLPAMRQWKNLADSRKSRIRLVESENEELKQKLYQMKESLGKASTTLSERDEKIKALTKQNGELREKLSKEQYVARLMEETTIRKFGEHLVEQNSALKKLEEAERNIKVLQQQLTEKGKSQAAKQVEPEELSLSTIHFWDYAPVEVAPPTTTTTTTTTITTTTITTTTGPPKDLCPAHDTNTASGQHPASEGDGNSSQTV